METTIMGCGLELQEALSLNLPSPHIQTPEACCNWRFFRGDYVNILMGVEDAPEVHAS